MIFGSFERMVAFRYLRARRQEGFISVIAAFSLLGIMLGVGTLIVVMSVMNGFEQEFLKQILGFNGDVTVYANQGVIRNYPDLAARIQRIDGIVSATPIVEREVVLSTDKTWAGAKVRGVSLDDLKRQKDISGNIVAGSLDALDDDSVVLGGQLAYSMNVHVGDSISLLSPQGLQTAFGTVPRTAAYKVAAIFDTHTQYDAGFAFITLHSAQNFFALGDTATSILVFVDNPAELWRWRGDISNAVGQEGRLYDWQSGASPFLNAVRTERNVMFLILTLIILVAAFNVISSMIMLVRSKGRDIAILRTMGATRGMILRIFFLTGASIGVAGTILGFAAGLAFAENIERIRHFLEGMTGTNLFSSEIYFLSQLPAKVDPVEVGVVVGVALVLSFLATLYPSWRAARLDPVEALRYE